MVIVSRVAVGTSSTGAVDRRRLRSGTLVEISFSDGKWEKDSVFLYEMEMEKEKEKETSILGAGQARTGP